MGIGGKVDVACLELRTQTYCIFSENRRNIHYLSDRINVATAQIQKREAADPDYFDVLKRP